MNFDLTEDQLMLKKAAQDFLQRECPLSLVRAMEVDERGYSPELWGKIAQLGWLGLIFSDEYGGGGANFVDLAVLLEVIGYRLAPGPFLATALCGSVLTEGGTPEQRHRFLPALASGQLIMVPALYEPSLRPDGFPELTTAVREEDGYRLSGIKLFVEYGHISDYLLVTARVDGGEDVGFFLVETRSDGVKWEPLSTIDSGKHHRVSFEAVRVGDANRLGGEEMGFALLKGMLLRGSAASCAWMVGGAQWVLDTTVAYTKLRVQFDRPIGAFQAIQHKLADMALLCDSARYMTYQAAWRLSESLPCEREVAMAKAWASEAYRRICLESHQIHGAIAFTEEYDLQLYTRRAKAAELFFGDARWHREIVAELLHL